MNAKRIVLFWEYGFLKKVMVLISRLCGLLSGKVPFQIRGKLSAKLTNRNIPEKDDIILMLIKMIDDMASIDEAERSY